MKFLAIIPVVFSAISLTLTMLALFAGHKKGFMEDYHVMVFNTSTLGHNFLSGIAGGDSSSSSSTTATGTGTAATATSTDGGGFSLPNPFTNLKAIRAAEATPAPVIKAHPNRNIFSSLEATATGLAGSLESSASSILGDVGNDVADKLADELGISQFYTVHIMDLCQGDYAPNATAGNAWMNITECTRPMDFSAMDLSDVLDKQLSIGPFNVSLSDLGFTQKLEAKLSKLPEIFEALAAIYIISALFAALTLFTSLASLFLLRPGSSRKLVLADVILAFLAALFIFVGSLLYTVGAKAAVGKIQGLGAGDIGLDVEVGAKFQALTWASFALAFVALAYWGWEFVAATRERRRARKVERRKVEGYEMGSPRARAPKAGRGWWS